MAKSDIFRASKQVIEGRFLAALDDKTKVAAILDDIDLNILITSIVVAMKVIDASECTIARMNELLEDLRALRKEAFRS